MSCSFENYGAFFKSAGAFGEEQGGKKKNVCFDFYLFSPILVGKGGECMKVILDPRGYSMEEVYEAYEGLCRKTVRAYGWEGVSKEDLFQECVLELCRCVRDFDPDRGVAFPAYVQRALKYRVYGAQRKWLKGQVDSLDAGEDFQEALLDPFDLEEAVCREEEKRRLDFYLGSLSPRQEEVLRLYYYENLSLSEIAGFLGLAYKTVENTKAAGLRNLRRLFYAYGQEVDSF